MICSLAQSDWLILVRLIAAYLFIECFFHLPFWKSPKLKLKYIPWLHGLVAGIISCFFAYCFKFNLYLFWLFPLIFFSRLGMDILEVKKTAPNTVNHKIKIMKHLVYLLVITGSWIGLVGISKVPIEKSFLYFSNLSIWIVSLAYITLIWPIGYLIGAITEPWRIELQQANEEANIKPGQLVGELERNIIQSNAEGLAKAGLWLGRLERILILTFVLLSKFEAIGFLITAKSIFRYSEIKCSRDRKEAEYILIGTMMSFVVALLVGIFANWLLTQIKP